MNATKGVSTTIDEQETKAFEPSIYAKEFVPSRSSSIAAMALEDAFTKNN